LLISTSSNCSQIRGHFPVWCGGPWRQYFLSIAQTV